MVYQPDTESFVYATTDVKSAKLPLFVHYNNILMLKLTRLYASNHMQTSFFDVIYIGPWVSSQENLLTLRG
jgi:hypothetical protein